MYPFESRRHNDWEVGFHVLVVTVDLLLIQLTKNLGTLTSFSGIEILNWSRFGFSSIYK